MPVDWCPDENVIHIGCGGCIEGCAPWGFFDNYCIEMSGVTNQPGYDCEIWYPDDCTILNHKWLLNWAGGGSECYWLHEYPFACAGAISEPIEMWASYDNPDMVDGPTIFSVLFSDVVYESDPVDTCLEDSVVLRLQGANDDYCNFPDTITMYPPPDFGLPDANAQNLHEWCIHGGCWPGGMLECEEMGMPYFGEGVRCCKKQSCHCGAGGAPSAGDCSSGGCKGDCPCGEIPTQCEMFLPRVCLPARRFEDFSNYV